VRPESQAALYAQYHAIMRRTALPTIEWLQDVNFKYIKCGGLHL